VTVIASAADEAAQHHLDDPDRLAWLAEQIAVTADAADPAQDARSHAVRRPERPSGRR